VFFIHRDRVVGDKDIIEATPFALFLFA